MAERRPRIHRAPRSLAALCFAALAGGCGRDNGLPVDLTEHLVRNGISVDLTGSEAPWSSRAGLVFFEAAPDIERAIIAAFELEPVERDSPEFELVTGRVVATAKALWGTTGRPATLRLEDGGQFEYLYLLQTEEGRTYLVAEYAYG